VTLLSETQGNYQREKLHNIAETGGG